MRINFKNKISFTRQRLGFTLVELLVVIAILGILATLIIVATNESRARGRDARRTADVKVMSDALELYVEDNIIAPPLDPDGYDWNTVISYISGYIRGGSIPLDPLEENGYHYVICSSGNDAAYPKSNFLVAAVMEVDYTAKGITGDLDSAHGYTLATDCIASSDGSAPLYPTTLNCSDTAITGAVDGMSGSVLCMGYYRND